MTALFGRAVRVDHVADTLPRVKALRRLTVRAAFPPELVKLGEIVSNLRWSWHPDSLDLLESVDPDLWASCSGDPARMLGEVSADRLAVLARDRQFLRRLDDVHDDLTDYLTQPRWYQQQQAAAPAPRSCPAAIAYFSPEFGITEVLPQYSGGLGILAGDHLKAASDLGVPIIGVGLLYRAGYFSQSLSRDGWQLERYPSLDPQGLPITAAARRRRRSPVRIALALPERPDAARPGLGRRRSAGCRCCCSTPTSRRTTPPPARSPTASTAAARSTGCEQELLLGIGGVRAIRAYCAATGAPAPEVFHTNEGHAGFLGVERIRELVERARAELRRGAAGGPRRHRVHHPHAGARPASTGSRATWSPHHLAGIAGRAGRAHPRARRRGGPDDLQHGPHGAAARPAGQRRVAAARRGQPRACSPTCGPASTPPRCRSRSITNGVHAPTWMSREILELAEREVGADAMELGGGWDGVDRVGDAELWSVRRDAARAAGRRDPPPDPAQSALQRGDERGRAGLDRRRPSTRTCSPSASPAGCRPTSG